MKVTALIDDDLIEKAIEFTEAKNISEALRAVLNEYVRIKTIRQLEKRIKDKPLKFAISAEEIRELNRNIT